MDERLNIYQQLMLENIIYYIGIQPYIVMCSDDDEILNVCVEEIVKRIDAIKCLYDYPHLFGQLVNAEWIERILTVEYKNIILMDFNKMMKERINSNFEHYNQNNINKYRHIHAKTIYDMVVWDYMVCYRESLQNASLIVPCSGKLSRVDIKDFCGFIRVFHLDKAKEWCTRSIEDEDEIKEKIKMLRDTDYNDRYKDRIW